MTPDVAVIIVTHEGEGCVGAALASLRAERSVRQTIVIDNASSDRTRDAVRQFSGVTLIESAKNVGFGAAHALAIPSLSDQVRYLFLMNQDAYLLPGALDQLRQIAGQSAEFAVLSPLQVEAPGGRLDSSFASFGLGDVQRRLVMDAIHARLEDVYEVAFTPAAAWLVERRAFVELGGFSRAFRQYGEDVQFCQRLALAGLRVGVCPIAEVVHARTTLTDARARRHAESARIQSRAVLEVMDLRRSLLRSSGVLLVRTGRDVVGLVGARRPVSACLAVWGFLRVMVRLPRLARLRAGERSLAKRLATACRSRSEITS